MENRPANDPATASSPADRKRGRPRKTTAKTQAERAKAYRQRLKSDGLKAVKCHLDAEHLAYLRAICDIHGGTIADAVALALSAVMRGELPLSSPLGKPLQPPSVILLP